MYQAFITYLPLGRYLCCFQSFTLSNMVYDPCFLSLSSCHICLRPKNTTPSRPLLPTSLPLLSSISEAACLFAPVSLMAEPLSWLRLGPRSRTPSTSRLSNSPERKTTRDSQPAEVLRRPISSRMSSHVTPTECDFEPAPIDHDADGLRIRNEDQVWYNPVGVYPTSRPIMNNWRATTDSSRQ